jgi:chemotaxis protein MotA
MNLSIPLGLVLGIAVVLTAGMSGIKNVEVFLSPHAAMIVLGGTLAAALTCFPISHFINLGKVFTRSITGATKAAMIETINEIVRASRALNEGAPIAGETAKIKNAFLKEALTLMETGGLADVELYEVLEKRVEMQNERYRRDGLTFKIIGKFPPAFGLVGTTMGMIALLQGLGGENAFEKIGPAMSIALVATFYGLVTANVILIPIGENLGAASEDDLIIRRIVVEGVRLLKEQKHPLLVEEYLKSYLSPEDRTKMQKATG